MFMLSNVKSTYDVIVVGGGGSGLAAAVSAAQLGADVLLLEKCPQLGGTTGISVGSFTANGTRLQQRAGLRDDPDDHQEDAGGFARPEVEARNNPSLRRFFLGHSADTLHWLIDLGLTFHGPSPEPPNRVPRMHNVVPGAKAYIATLQAKLTKLGGTILVNAPVRHLLCEASQVGGVLAEIGGEELRFRAHRGVVLAAGDYANSPDIISRYKGDQYSSIEGINPDADGDGHRLAESVGGKLLNMDITYGPELRFVPPPGRTFQQLLPASGLAARAMGRLLPLVPQFVIDAMIRRLLVTWQHPEDALFHDGAVLINRRGERFCDETVWPEREIAVAQQPLKECFILLDRRLIDKYSSWPHFVSTAPKIAYAYVTDYLKLRPDVAVQAGSLTELAAQRGLPADRLQATVAASPSIGLGTPSQDSAGERWVLLGPAKAWFTTTEGGAAINQKFQVLDQHDRPIPGLHAVGQTGLGGQVLWGHGLHIAWAMTSGRLAGQVLAESCKVD